MSKEFYGADPDGTRITPYVSTQKDAEGIIDHLNNHRYLKRGRYSVKRLKEHGGSEIVSACVRVPHSDGSNTLEWYDPERMAKYNKYGKMSY